MNTFCFSVVHEKHSEGYFVYCLGLEGCHSERSLLL